MRRSLTFSLSLALILLIAACGGGGGAAEVTPGAQTPAIDEQTAATPPDRRGDERELSTLVEIFFNALVKGDGDTVWSVLGSEVRAEVTREQVAATAEVVRAAYEEPAFVLEGLRDIRFDGERAEFFVDGYISDGGVRPDIGIDTEGAAPLEAVRENGRWRLLPSAQFLTVGDLRLSVD